MTSQSEGLLPSPWREEMGLRGQRWDAEEINVGYTLDIELTAVLRKGTGLHTIIETKCV